MGICSSIDPLVTPYVDGELPERDRALVEEHLRRCGPCRARVAAEGVVRRLLRERKAALASDAASPALHSRCAAFRARADAPAASWRHRVAPFALAATLVLVVGGAFLSQATDRSGRVLAAQLAADHVKCFALNDVLNTHEAPSVLQSSMLAGFGWRPTFDAGFDRAQLDLVGGRRCLYAHGLVAHLMYRHDGQPVSIFMLPGTTHADELVDVLGHQAAIWSVDDRTFVLIARGSQAEVARIAGYVKAALR